MTQCVDLRDPADVRDILGLRTPATRALVAAVVVAMAYGASQSLDGLSPSWPALVVVAIMGATTVALIAVPHDPLPIVAAVVIALAPPAAAAILLSVAPVPIVTANQIWVSGYATLIYVFMCMRGRILWAWLSLVLSVGVHAAWAALSTQSVWDGMHVPIYNAGALLATTLIALAIRSTTGSILSLRTADEQRAADAAAITAGQHERNTRLAALDQLAQPMLARIATGVPLSDTERQACELLEAHLRDQLRAPALATPAIAAAARAARARGVEVMLIDDGGLTGISDLITTTVQHRVTAALNSATDGEVRVRIMPKGRANVATIYRHGEAGTIRVDIDALGEISKGASTPPIPGSQI